MINKDKATNQTNGSCLLFIDVLGTKNAWKADGRKGVEGICKWFRTILVKTLVKVKNDGITDGVIESDSAAFIFPNTYDAINVARHLFLDTFLFPKDSVKPRRWLRGAIIGTRTVEGIRLEKSIQRIDNLRLVEYSGGLMEVLNVEKSGYKGMRIIIQRELITKDIQNKLAIRCGKLWMLPLKRLKYSSYPPRIQNDYEDVLWMACGNSKKWRRPADQMTRLLRWSGSDMEEISHAAATQIVFNECAAIMGSKLKHQGLGDDMGRKD